MNVLIIGAGAIGVSIGASLADQKVNVSFLATSKTGRTIESQGIKRTGLFGDISIPPERLSVYYDYDAMPEGGYDYICICVKTMANEETALRLFDHRRVLKPGGIIVVMQNGWGNDIPYLKYFSPEIVYNARVITGFERKAPNISNITVHTAPLLIGSLHGYSKEKAASLAAAISAGGIPSDVTDEVGKALWAKMLYNCTLNPLGAVLQVSYGSLADDPSTRDIMNMLIREIFDVMEAAGYKTFWDNADEYINEFYRKLIPDTGAHFSSTYQDMVKKQKTEIETLTGTILRLAREYGVSVPTHRVLYNEVRFLENMYL